MNRLKKSLLCLLILLISIVIVATFSLSGCKEEAAKEEAAKEEESVEDIWGTEPIDMVIWTWATEPAMKVFYDYVVAEYKNLHPNINITWQAYDIGTGGYIESLKAAISGGKGPDLFGMDLLTTDVCLDYINAGVTYDVTDILETDAEWKGWIQPSLQFKELYWGDDQRIYWVPQSCQYRSILYWREFWPNGMPNTQAELYERSAEIKDMGLIPMDSAGYAQLCVTEAFANFVHQMDLPDKQMISQAQKGQISWINDTFKAAAEAIIELYNKGVWPQDFLTRRYMEDSFEAFYSKKATSFWTGGPWLISSLDEEALDNDEIGTDLMPALEEGMEKQALGGVGKTMCVNADNAHVEIALDILKFTNSPGVQAKLIENLGEFPPGAHLFAGQTTGVKLYDEMMANMATLKLGPYYYKQSQIADAIYTELSKVVLGQQTVDVALEAIQKVSDEVNARK